MADEIAHEYIALGPAKDKFCQELCEMQRDASIKAVKMQLDITGLSNSTTQSTTSISEQTSFLCQQYVQASRTQCNESSAAALAGTTITIDPHLEADRKSILSQMNNLSAEAKIQCDLLSGSTKDETLRLGAEMRKTIMDL